MYADERVEDPKGTCLGCGADTYDLRSISNGGPDAKWSPFDGDVDAAGA